jgi:hypothetical protein
VRMIEMLSSETANVGDRFHGTLVAPVVVNGRTLFSKGADVTGEVVNVERSGRLSNPGELYLNLRTVRSRGRTRCHWRGRGRSRGHRCGGSHRQETCRGAIGGGPGLGGGRSGGGACGAGATVPAAQPRALRGRGRAGVARVPAGTLRR